MLGLVRAPIELAFSVAKVGVEAGMAVARAAWGLIGDDAERTGWDVAGRPDPPPRPHASAATAAPVAEPVVQPPRSAPEPAPPPEPAHVSEEAVVVAQVAEAGVEDGAGAELAIEPPWEGYDRQDVREIADRLKGAGAAAVATVELYESANKQRRGVVDAAQRRLKQLSGPAAARNR